MTTITIWTGDEETSFTDVTLQERLSRSGAFVLRPGATPDEPIEGPYVYPMSTQMALEATERIMLVKQDDEGEMCRFVVIVGTTEYEADTFRQPLHNSIFPEQMEYHEQVVWDANDETLIHPAGAYLSDLDTVLLDLHVMMS